MAKAEQTQQGQANMPVGSETFYPPPQRIPIQRRPSREETPQEEAQGEELQAQGLYIISVASRILEMHPQTLRKYERLGLVRPSRTVGMLRLYSQEDIQKLRLIKRLQEEMGLNLAGVEVALRMFQHLMAMRRRLIREAEVEAVRQIVEQEIEELFRLLRLPEPEL